MLHETCYITLHMYLYVYAVCGVVLVVYVCCVVVCVVVLMFVCVSVSLCLLGFLAVRERVTEIIATVEPLLNTTLHCFKV